MKFIILILQLHIYSSIVPGYRQHLNEDSQTFTYILGYDTYNDFRCLRMSRTHSHSREIFGECKAILTKEEHTNKIF